MKPALAAALRQSTVRLHGQRAAERFTDEDLVALGAYPIEQLTLLRQQITKLPPLAPRLRTLWIGACDIASLEGIEQQIQLQTLWLTELPQLDLARVFALCAELPELTELRLGGLRVPMSIAKLLSLVAVELEGTPELADAFVALGGSATLRSLRVRGNGRLPDALAPLARLELFDVKGAVGPEIPRSVGAMRALTKLALDDCKFAALPPTIGQLGMLEELNLRGNPITSLPDELCACSNLRVLVLDGTRIKALPAQIGRLANLRELRAYAKPLRTVPASLGDLAELRVLHLPGTTSPCRTASIACASRSSSGPSRSRRS